MLTPCPLEGASFCWAPDEVSGEGDWRPWFCEDISRFSSDSGEFVRFLNQVERKKFVR